MPKFDIYFKENESDSWLTYYTTLEADSQEHAELLAQDILDSIESSKENYDLERAYDELGDYE